MSYYFNTKEGHLVESTDGVPECDEITELDELEYIIMSLRIRHSSLTIIDALELVDNLYSQVGK